MVLVLCASIPKAVFAPVEKANGLGMPEIGKQKKGCRKRDLLVDYDQKAYRVRYRYRAPTVRRYGAEVDAVAFLKSKFASYDGHLVCSLQYRIQRF
jgi:hypothetical protein